MASAAEQAAPWLKGRSFDSWREQFDRRRLSDLRARAFRRAGRGDPRRTGAASGARPQGPQRFRGREDQPRLCADGEVAGVRGARDPSAGAGLCRSRARRELPALGTARDQPASRRDRAALAHRRWRRANSAAAAGARHQHVLGDRRHHRTERRHRDHSGQPCVGRSAHRGRGVAVRLRAQGRRAAIPASAPMRSG